MFKPPAMTEISAEFHSLAALLSDNPIAPEILQSVFPDDMFQSDYPERSTDSEEDESMHVKLELVAEVLGVLLNRLKKDYKHFCRARAEVLAEQQTEKRRREVAANRLRKAKQKQSKKKQKPKQVAPAGCSYRPKIKPMLTKPVTIPIPEPIQSVPEVSMDLRLDFAYCNKPIGKQPAALDRAMMGIALAVDTGMIKIDEIYDFLTDRLGLEDYIDNSDSYYQDTSGILRVVRRQLTTAGYILVGKCGTVQITPEGRAKLQGKSTNGKSISVTVPPPERIESLIESKPPVEIIKLREAITEHEQLLLISAEEEAINAAAVQGIMSQIPAVRYRLAQVQRELDTLINRQHVVEAKVAQSKKEQDDLRREIEKIAVQIPILEQVLFLKENEHGEEG
jgi:hypothetical protein